MPRGSHIVSVDQVNGDDMGRTDADIATDQDGDDPMLLSDAMIAPAPHDSKLDDVFDLGSEQALDASQAGEDNNHEAADDASQAELSTGPKPKGAVVRVLAVFAALGWTGLYVAAHLSIVPAVASRWINPTIGWLEGWSGPILLIALVWLMLQRQTWVQGQRSAAAASQLTHDTGLLEARLLTINRELGLAREFMAAQTRDLDSLGRVAVERIGQHADHLGALILGNGAQVDAIGKASAAARENMELLRGHLPVITSSVKDVTNTIGNAGRVAQMQLQELVNGMNRLNAFGNASDNHVQKVRSGVEAVLKDLNNQFNTLLADVDLATDQRIQALTIHVEKFSDDINTRENLALSAIDEIYQHMGTALDDARARIEAQEDASLTALNERLAAFQDQLASVSADLRDSENQALFEWRARVARLETVVREAMETLETIDRQAMTASQGRLEAISKAVAEVDNTLIEAGERADAETSRWLTTQRQRLVDLAEASADIDKKLAPIDVRTMSITAEVNAAHQRMLEHVSLMNSTLNDSRRNFSAAEAAISSLTDGSVRLLELLQSSVQCSRDQLPKAITASETRLTALAETAINLRDTIGEADEQGARLADNADLTRGAIIEAANGIDMLHCKIETRTRDHGDMLDDLRQRLATTASETDTLASHAQDTLTVAIDELMRVMREAINGIEAQGAGGIARLAERLGRESNNAIERAIRDQSGDMSRQIDAAVTHASDISREAARHFRDQLVRIDELTGNLERRVTQARAQAEEQIDHDFVRRVAIITETLNSNAIDIAKMFDADIADTAWASYLKGDRGIFTRRAVKLLGATDAKNITHIYNSDPAFHDHVSRYIHDFETMLRQLLSTRDGHSMSVTLLSSDMGKLYVMLAQAISRLRL